MTAPLHSDLTTGRRTFIKTAAVAGVALAGWKPTLGRGGVLQKLNVASIGVGGMGSTDLAQIASHPEVVVVGLCDTDANNLGKAGGLHPDAKRFADGREMFAKMGDEFDAVSITTPDHMHAIYAMMAMNGGKHVYCQKPLAWSVHENRALAKAAAANPSLATQMGTQNASRPMKQRCMKFVRDGNLGKIRDPRPERSPDLAAGESTSQGRRSGPGAPVLGPLARRRPRKAVQERCLPRLRVARRPRLRLRGARRHGLPHRRRGLPAPRAG